MSLLEVASKRRRRDHFRETAARELALIEQDRALEACLQVFHIVESQEVAFRLNDALISDHLTELEAHNEGLPFVIRTLRETLINGPTSEVAGEMASNFLDDEANRRSIQ
ncbi:hypothetical protein [Burkholderia vietnamiensis]|uniref:hypothetical protein n=1 Tax=Burkholderia vietnamiensis TaxID=60552 RepID=UPI001592DB8A|nr:hypothetical protein [Burkholderia vietnamiensis]